MQTAEMRPIKYCLFKPGCNYTRLKYLFHQIHVLLLCVILFYFKVCCNIHEFFEDAVFICVRVCLTGGGGPGGSKECDQ